MFIIIELTKLFGYTYLGWIICKRFGTKHKCSHGLVNDIRVPAHNTYGNVEALGFVGDKTYSITTYTDGNKTIGLPHTPSSVGFDRIIVTRNYERFTFMFDDVLSFGSTISYDYEDCD